MKSGFMMFFLLLGILAQACSLKAPEEASSGAPPVNPVDEGGPLWAQSTNSRVREDYGVALVREGSFHGESKVKPWSAYWYPSRDDWMLFRGLGPEHAPLQKYDEWVKKAHHETAASAEYESGLFDPESKNFEGLCSAWAMASVMEPEPTKAKELNGVKFTTTDLKALLIKSYETIAGTKTYGKVVQDSDEVCQGICPDQFHRLIQAEVLDRHQPVLIDKDPGPATWLYPVFGVEVTILRDAQDSHVMHVDAQITTVGPFQASQISSLGSSMVNFRYTYDLFGVPQPDGSLEAHAGRWTRDSLVNHPDFVVIPPADKKLRHSNNPQLKTEWVDELISKSRG